MQVKIFIALVLGAIWVIATAEASQTQVFLQIVESGTVLTGTHNTGTIVPPSDTTGSWGYAGGKMPILVTTGFGSPTLTGNDVFTGRKAGPYMTGDRELYSGYKWAYEQGITYRPTFDEKALYGTPTRADLAKMITVFANHSLGMPITSSAACDITLYKDFSQMTGNERFYIKQACDLGLMGWKNDKSGLVEWFQPNALVTRAALGTVLSRLLYGDQFNGTMGNERYVGHLEALNKAGYMHKIDTPHMLERYGYIMLMMQRIANKDSL